MKTDSHPHILCVNPWIHDFAAFDFWAKPLGLLSIAAILRENQCKVSYIDCLDRFHPRQTQPVKCAWDGRGPYRKTPLEIGDIISKIPESMFLPGMHTHFSRYGIDPAWFRQDLENLPKPDLIFVTSVMTYWATGVAETIACIKQVYPDVPVVLGGIYASLCHEHALAHSGADRVIKGPGEQVLKEMIKKFTSFNVDISQDVENLDCLPFPALDLAHHMAYAPILTSRGCPFSCEYCASSFLEPKLRRRSPENVFKEIVHWHKNYGVKNFAFYDDALLVNSKDYAFPLLEKIIESKMDLWFHTPNALHIRGITPKASDLMFKAGFKTIRLGLETTDFSSHRSHDVKVRAHEFFNAVAALKSAGFDQSQMGAYLLCGLPDQNLDDVKSSMKLVKDSGILPVLAYYTPIPHTPMWDEALEKARFDISQHPVFTNNTLFPCVKSDLDIQRIYQLKNNKI